MKETQPPSTPRGQTDLKQTLNGLVAGWRAGATLLNERLTVLGTPRSQLQGAAGTVLATDDQGAPVTVTAVQTVSAGVATDIARQLSSLERSLERGGGSRRPGRVVVLCSEPPSIQAWRALSVRLGARDCEVYLQRRRNAERLQPPAGVAHQGSRLAGPGEWSLTDWIAAGALLLGVLLTILGLRGLAG